MPVQKLPLPDCIETLVFRAITNKLGNDPVLSNVLKTTYFYDGDLDDIAPIDDVNKLPYLSVQPVPAPSQVSTERHSVSTMAVSIEIGIEGTNFDDMLNLWSAVRNCFFPGDGSMQTIMNNVKSNNPNESWTGLLLDQPSYRGVQLPDGSQMLAGTGTVVAKLWQSTAL